jgi:drug/metabolite transporter (DMT)-like permease
VSSLPGWVVASADTGLSPGLVSAVVFGIASAAAYGFGAVLQHQAAVREPAYLSMRAGLLLQLVRRPWWVVGNVLDGVGYVFQFLALRTGSLALVEPLLVLSLLFALPMSARLAHRRASRTELVAALMTLAGLAVFLGAARPGPGSPHATAAQWLGLTVGIGALVLLLVVAARRGSRRRAAVLLAGGSGAAFGYVAAVTERTAHLLSNGWLHVLATWAPYALVGGGFVALLLAQSAFHAGELRWSLPTLTLSQPFVAIAIGVGIFGEHLATNGLAPLFELLGLALVTAGVVALAQPSVIGVYPEEQPQ